MFQISNNTYIERGYLIEIDNDGAKCHIKLTQEDSINLCYQYIFTLTGTYPDQEKDLVDDCIDMYERKALNK